MVGINCNGNEFYFYLQSGLIAVIRSKHILGLTTSLTLQTKLPHKLGPAGQLTMLSEKSVTWKMDLLLVFSLHGAFFIHLTILITLQIKHGSFFSCCS